MKSSRFFSSSLILFFITFFYIFLKGNVNYLNTNNNNNLQIHHSAECLQSNIEKYIGEDKLKLWSRFSYIVNKCSPRFENVKLEEFANNDELKYHFLPIKHLESCSIISLGIGKDVRAEKRMKRFLPNCVFHGSDPVVEDNQELYSEVGFFHNLAVGDRNGSFRSYILEDIYRYQDVPGIDIATFIRKNVNTTIVDQILMDIEHGEYLILPFFHYQGLLMKHGIHVCQINIEIHFPTKIEEQIDIFYNFLKNNFFSHNWIFINSEIHFLLGHIRLFMINGRNEECLNRYIPN